MGSVDASTAVTGIDAPWLADWGGIGRSIHGMDWTVRRACSIFNRIHTCSHKKHVMSFQSESRAAMCGPERPRAIPSMFLVCCVAPDERSRTGLVAVSLVSDPQMPVGSLLCNNLPLAGKASTVDSEPRCAGLD